MLPLLILVFLQRYQRSKKLTRALKCFYFLLLVLTVVLNLWMIKAVQAQERILHYSVSRNGTEIGQMQLKETKNGDRLTLRLDMLVCTRMIFRFTAKGVEEAVYDKGVLVYSSVYQDMNGTEKLNKQTRLEGNNYVIKNKGKEETINKAAICYNMVCLYTHEPLPNSQVYSDRFQKFLLIEKMEDHHYKIGFPDGNANEYFYRNGLCTKIVIDHSFYSAVMEIKW